MVAAAPTTTTGMRFTLQYHKVYFIVPEFHLNGLGLEPPENMLKTVLDLT